MKYESHPIANEFPMLPENELQQLADDIRENGLKLPITLCDGKILDGRNRYEACKRANIEPRFETLPSAENPIKFVISRNIRHRHLTATQRGKIAKNLANILKTDFKGNQYTGKSGDGRSAASKTVVTRQEAADLMGVSDRLIGQLRYVDTYGGAEVKEALEKNEIVADAANRIAHLPKAEQPAAVEAAKNGQLSRQPNKAAKPKTKRRNEEFYWQKYSARSEKLATVRTFVEAPSLYPKDVKLPVGMGNDEKSLLEAIAELRKNESSIPKMKKLQLDELIYPYTQRIQTYVINRLNAPRPEGPLDDRLYQWAVNAAKKMNGRQDFLRFVNQQKEIEKNEREEVGEVIKPRLSEFDIAFKELWESQYKVLIRFRIAELPKIKERWLEAIDKLFQLRAKRSQELKKYRVENGSKLIK